MKSPILSAAAITWAVFAAAVAASGDEKGPVGPANKAIGSIGISAGLCVQIGADDTTLAAEWAGTGRLLVHVLDADEKTVGQSRDRLARQGRYGLVSVERWEATGRLPYAEDLVNLLVILKRPAARIPAQEIKRVLCPNGVVLADPGTMTAAEFREAALQPLETLPAGRAWLGAKKPRPAEMDDWPNPRHSADGNAVQLVSAADGKPLFGHAFDPGMGHEKQARPLFIGDRFWVLHVGPGARSTGRWPRFRPSIWPAARSWRRTGRT